MKPQGFIKVTIDVNKTITLNINNILKYDSINNENCRITLIGNVTYNIIETEAQIDDLIELQRI